MPQNNNELKFSSEQGLDNQKDNYDQIKINDQTIHTSITGCPIRKPYLYKLSEEEFPVKSPLNSNKEKYIQGS